LYTVILFILFLPVFYYRYIEKSDSNKLIFLRIFLVSEFTLISFVFRYNINSLVVKKIMAIAPFLFFAFSVYDFIISKPGNFSFVPLAVECLILIIYIIYFFFEKIQINTSIPLYTTYIFWFAVAFILYSSGNFFLFLYSNAFSSAERKSIVFNNQYTLIYSTFTVLKNVFLCIGILLTQKKKKEPYASMFDSHDPFDFIINREITN